MTSTSAVDLTFDLKCAFDFEAGFDAGLCGAVCDTFEAGGLLAWSRGLYRELYPRRSYDKWQMGMLTRDARRGSGSATVLYAKGRGEPVGRFRSDMVDMVEARTLRVAQMGWGSSLESGRADWMLATSYVRDAGAPSRPVCTWSVSVPAGLVTDRVRVGLCDVWWDAVLELLTVLPVFEAYCSYSDRSVLYLNLQQRPSRIDRVQPIVGCRWMSVIPQSVADHHFGGVEAMARAAPVERACVVTAANGVRCVVTRLGPDPEELTVDQLRASRDFLGDAAVVHHARTPHSWGVARPADVLADDWPFTTQ